MPSTPTVVELLPTPSDLARVLRPWARRSVWVTALDEGRLTGLHAALGGDEDQEAEVIPFGELLGRGLQRLNQPLARLSTPRQTEMALGASLRELPSERPLAAMAQFPGFHRRIASTLRQLRHHRVDAEALRRAAPALSPTLGPVVEDLATLAEALAERWRRLGRETVVDRLTRLEAAPASAYSGLDHWETWWILVGPDDDPVARRALLRAAEYGAPVVLAMEGIPGRDDLFAGLAAWRRALTPPPASQGELQLGLGFEDDRADTDAPSHPGVPELPWWSQLFDGAPSPCPGAAFRVTRYATPTALSEAEWILRDAQALISAGTMPHRVAILARDESAYAARLEMAAERLGVPLDTRRQIPLVQNPFIRWLLELLEGLAGDDPRGLEPAMLSVYADAHRHAMAPQLSQLYRLRQSANPWADLRRDAELHADAQSWLVTALDWRDDALREPVVLPEWFQRLQTLLESPPLPDVVALAGSLTAERDLRAQAAALRSLSDAVSTLDAEGVRPLSLWEFVALAKSLWQNDTTMVPARQQDGIRLASRPDDLGRVDHVLAVGLTEGSFPRRRREDPVLRDEDRHALTDVLELADPLPDSRQEARHERDAFVRLCALPRGSLTLTFPQDSSDQERIPTFYLQEVTRVGGVEVVDLGTRPALILDPVACRFRPDLDLAEAFRASVETPDLTGLRSEALRDRLGPASHGVTSAEVVSAFRCPFRFAFQHRIRLESRRTSAAFYRLTRIPERAGLSNAVDAADARQRLVVATDEVYAEIATGLERWERDLWRSVATRLVDGWIEREMVSRTLWTRESLGTAAPNLTALPDGPLPLRLPAQTVPLNATVAGRYQALGRTVVRLYRSRLPQQSTDSGSQAASWDDDLLESALLLSMLQHALKTPVAAEIETLNDARAFVFPREAVGLPMVRGNGSTIQVQALPSKDELREVITDLLRASGPELLRPSVRPVPGDQCRDCAFGDLCRQSRDQGESVRAAPRPGAPVGAGWSPEGLTDPEDA